MDYNEFTMAGRVKETLYETEKIRMVTLLTLREAPSGKDGKPKYFTNPIAVTIPKRPGLDCEYEPGTYLLVRGVVSADRRKGNWDRFFFNAKRVYRILPETVGDTVRNEVALEGSVSRVFRDEAKTSVSLMVKDRAGNADFVKVAFRGGLAEKASALKKGDYASLTAEAVYYDFRKADKKGVYFEGTSLIRLAPAEDGSRDGSGDGKEKAQETPETESGGSRGGYFDKARKAGIKKKL